MNFHDLIEDREAAKVIPMAKTMMAVSSSAARAELPAPEDSPRKKMELKDISAGNLPLQGTKQLVMMAISLSRGESMMRQPVTPVALQPKPIIMVSACLPQARQR